MDGNLINLVCCLETAMALREKYVAQVAASMPTMMGFPPEPFN